MEKIITTKSPYRLSFAGGFSDLEEYYERYGGAVTETAINIYSHAKIIERTDDVVRVVQEKLNIDQTASLGNLDGISDFYRVVIKHFSPKKGFDLILENDVSYGSGLGSSSAAMVSIIGAFNKWLDGNLVQGQIAELAHCLERSELNIYAGKQDPYSTVFGGLNYIEFHKDGKVEVEKLRLDDELLMELQLKMLAVNTCIPRTNTNQIRELIKKINESDGKVLETLNSMKICAGQVKRALEKEDLGEIGELVSEDWASKITLANDITSARIDGIFKLAMANGAEGGKLLGAGMGGYIVLIIDADKRRHLMNVLTNDGLKVYEPQLVKSGLETASSG